jgi:dTMP kinase
MAASRIAAIERAVLDGFKPHLTLVLDLPVEIGLARAHARAGTETRFEQFDTAFHTRLRDGFLIRARAEPERCAVIDANGDVENVAARIWAETRRRFGL